MKSWIRVALRKVNWAVLMLLSCSVMGTTPAWAADSGLLVGVNLSMNDGAAGLKYLQWLGVNSVRLDMPWNMVERQAGHYVIPANLERTVNDAVAAGIEPLVILEYGNPLYGGGKPMTSEAREAFAQYARFVVTHFKDRVRYYDLWNEWEGRTGGTVPQTPEGYVSLARATYPIVKQANPNAIVLSGGIYGLGENRNWYLSFLRLGGLKYVDAISIHPYNYKFVRGSDARSAIGAIDQLHSDAVVANGGEDVAFYVTEFGYPAYGGRWGIDEDTFARDTADFLLLAAARPYLKGVWWYGARDQGVDPANKEHHFGLFTWKWEPKQAAEAFKEAVALIRATGPWTVQPDGSAISAVCLATGKMLVYSLVSPTSVRSMAMTCSG